MSILTFSEAARVTKRSLSTIYRYIKEGTISAVRLPNGKRGIDTAELERVFGSLKPLDTSQNAPVKQEKTVKAQVDVFQERDEVVGLLRQQVELLERELMSAKEEKIKLLGLLEQRLLESPRDKRRKGKKKGY